jgi:hypothetical protein
MIIDEGDCINSVSVGHNMDVIENLRFSTLNGKSHRMGKQNLINDDDETEFIQFGKDSCLVGISFGTAESHKAHGIKFWFQEFQVEKCDDCDVK